MNLLLLLPEELDPNGHAVLDRRRSEHLLKVLGVQPGQQLRAGCLGTSLGRAQVQDVRGEIVHVQYAATESLDPPPTRCLLLACPRPKVLSRCLQHAAALGYTQILLFRTARVDKAHLASHKLCDADIRRHCILGLEQGRRLFLPEVRLFARFRPFVEDVLPTLVPAQGRWLAHPSAERTTLDLLAEGATPPGLEFSLAIGPEGGFVPFEVELLAARGFSPVRAETGPLRVESALSYLTGQLELAVAWARRRQT